MTSAEAMREAAAKVADGAATSWVNAAKVWRDEEGEHEETIASLYQRADDAKMIAAAIRSLPIPPAGRSRSTL